MTTTITGQLVAAIKARKFTAISKLFAPGCDFQAWTNVGHWVATDGPTVSKIIEVWYTPGASSTVIDCVDTAHGKTAATLELEVSWKLPPEDQIRVLRQVYLLTIKADKIVHARVYCPGIHMDFPEVDLEKQRRNRGIGGAKPSNAPKMVAAKVN